MKNKKKMMLLIYLIVIISIITLGISFARPYFLENYKIAEGIIKSKIVRDKISLLPQNIIDVQDSITEVRFIGDTKTNIREKYDNASVKGDATLTESGENQGLVLAWV